MQTILLRIRPFPSSFVTSRLFLSFLRLGYLPLVRVALRSNEDALPQLTTDANVARLYELEVDSQYATLGIYTRAVDYPDVSIQVSGGFPKLQACMTR